MRRPCQRARAIQDSDNVEEIDSTPRATIALNAAALAANGKTCRVFTGG
jgi:hypothetical protein